MAGERHYDFLSLLRAKYSAMLYEQDDIYTCNNCKGDVETYYHCTICDDFDLCITCYDKDGHPHKMEKLGLDLDDGSSPADQNQANPQELRKLSIQRCIQSLVHACQCREAYCRLSSCEKMKRVIQHIEICKRKANGSCPICKQLIALACYHAKYCQETKCPVPFCENIKYKMKQQQLHDRLQQAQLLRKRMTVINTRGSVAVSPGAPQTVVMPSLPAPGPPHQPGIGLKPGTQTPLANVLQDESKDDKNRVEDNEASDDDKKFVEKVVSRDFLQTDKPKEETNATQNGDPNTSNFMTIFLGNKRMLPIFDESGSTSPNSKRNRKEGSEKKDSSDLPSGFAMYNGSLLDISKLQEQLSLSEESRQKTEKELEKLRTEHSQIKESNNKHLSTIKKLTADLNDYKERLTNTNSELSTIDDGETKLYYSTLLDIYEKLTPIVGSKITAKEETIEDAMYGATHNNSQTQFDGEKETSSSSVSKTASNTGHSEIPEDSESAQPEIETD